MKKWICIGACFFACVSVFGWWFWSLGHLPAAAQSSITLTVDRGFVEVRRASSNQWAVAASGNEVKNGDAVRTASDSAATIHVFGIGESRLAPGSEVVLFVTTSTQINLHLSVGRVWTRLLRLLDLDSFFVVQTNSVVATVRGTAFDVQADETGSTVLVTDSVVDITPLMREGALTSSTFPLVEGFLARIDAHGRLITSESLSDEVQRSAWFLENTKRDMEFENESHQAIKRNLALLGGVNPDSATAGLAQFSERMHLSLAGTDALALSARYAARRLFAIQRLMERGKSGFAFHLLSRLEEEIQIQISRPKTDAFRDALRDSLKDILRALEHTNSASPSYRLLQRVEDIAVMASQNSRSPEQAISAKLDSLQSTLITAKDAFARRDVEAIRGLLDATDHGLANAEQDFLMLPNATPEDRIRALDDKLTAVRAYAWTLEERRFALVEPIFVETSVIEQPIAPEIQTSTPTVPFPPLISLPSLAPSSSPTSTPTPISNSSRFPIPDLPVGKQASELIERVSLIANPNPAMIGEMVHLLASGIRSDGSSVDLTAQTTFSARGGESGLGTLNGPTYISDVAGSVTIIATSMDHGSALKSSTVIEVKATPRTLKSIDLIALGPTTITPGDSVGFRVVARYSDGRTQDVSTASTLTVSNSAFGSMNGITFQSARQPPPAAIATVTARYSELGVAATASMDVTIR